MEYKPRTQPEEWACTKFCRISLDDNSVAKFILWLCDHSVEQIGTRIAARSKDDVILYDPVESIWGWDAPRHRMAKLLWRALHSNASDKDFRQRFSFPTPIRTSGCAQLLSPIQERLKWVMEGFFSRQKQDYELGQGDWGEYWWLPKEQADFVRTQLRQSSADLIEQTSDYDDALAHGMCFHIRHTVQAIVIPCRDSARVYIGTRNGPHESVFVWVQSENGRQFPLKHGKTAYREADGTGFEWGYPGYGPGELAHCILLDALDGDLIMADELEDDFFKEFTLTYPREEELRISRVAVMRWLDKRGAKAKWEERRDEVAGRLARYADDLADKEDLLTRILAMGGLRTQRFDVVPTTFESALYLDLMRMLERSDFALRCSGCGLPIPYDNSGRANKQRARAKKGQPIYHSDCFAEYAKTRKKIYWQRRASSPQFREKQKARARDYRKLT